MIATQKIEQFDDLDLLVAGDAVDLKYVSSWNLKQTHNYHQTIFAGITNEREYCFACRQDFTSTFIQTYRAPKDAIQIENGMVVFDANRCKSEAIGVGQYTFFSHTYLDGLLKKS